MRGRRFCCYMGRRAVGGSVDGAPRDGLAGRLVGGVDGTGWKNGWGAGGFVGGVDGTETRFLRGGSPVGSMGRDGNGVVCGRGRRRCRWGGTELPRPMETRLDDRWEAWRGLAKPGETGRGIGETWAECEGNTRDWTSSDGYVTISTWRFCEGRKRRTQNQPREVAQLVAQRSPKP